MKELTRVWSKNGMKQIINSPHKTFNEQTNILTNGGNMIANTQVCHHIRAYNENVNPIGQIVPYGELQDYDFKMFSNLLYAVKKFCEQDKNATYWVSEIRLFNKYRKQVVCYFVRNNKTQKVTTFNCATNKKQYELVEWLKDYLFEKEEIKDC